MSLLLPVLQSSAGQQGQTVPAAPTPPVPQAPAAPTAPYEETWTMTLEPTEPLALAVGPSLLFTARPQGPIEARSHANGRVVWSRPLGADADPVVGDDLVFVRGSGTLYALDQASGRTRWTMAAPAGMPRPLFRAGWLVVPTGQSIRGFRASDGSAVWQRDLEGPVSRPFALDGDRLFAVVGTNQLAALDIKTGELQAKVQLDSEPESLVAFGERVYFGSNGFFVAYRQTPLRYDWHVRIFAPTVGEPVGDGPYIYVALLDNTVRILDRGHGTERRKIVLNSRPAPSPFPAGKYVIVPVLSGGLAVYDPSVDRTVAVLTAGKAPEQGTSILPTLEAVAGSPDGTQLFRVVKAINDTRTLTGFRRVK